MEKKGRFSPSTAWRWDEAPPRATQGGRGPPGPRSCIRSDGRGRPQARAQQRPLRERKPRGQQGRGPGAQGSAGRAAGPRGTPPPAPASILFSFHHARGVTHSHSSCSTDLGLFKLGGLKISTCIMLEKRASLCNRERKEVAG